MNYKIFVLNIWNFESYERIFAPSTTKNNIMNMNKYKQNLKIEGSEVISYSTKVAVINGLELQQLGYWSQTTQKHINYVAKIYGLKLIKP